MGSPSNQAGAAVRQLRTAQGLTQRDLAGDRYTPQYISSLEAGRARPSEKALVYLASRLGVTPGSLLDGEPRPISTLDPTRLIAAERALEGALTAIRQLREALALAPAIVPHDRHSTATRRRSRNSGGSSNAHRRQQALNLVIVDVLREAGEPLAAATIAERVIATGWRPPRSSQGLRPPQIYARTSHQHYRKSFTRRDGLIGLAEWQRTSARQRTGHPRPRPAG